MSDTGIEEVNRRSLQSFQFLEANAVHAITGASIFSTCKGLLFVGLYGLYEQAVRTAVQSTLQTIANDHVSLNDLHPAVLSIVLNAKFQSLAECGKDKEWSSRINLLTHVVLNTPNFEFEDHVFPSDGSHYRERQLLTIWEIFRVTTPTLPASRLRGRVNELVENRNAVAHGRDSAEEVGRRYSLEDMQTWIVDVTAIATYVLSELNASSRRRDYRRT